MTDTFGEIEALPLETIAAQKIVAIEPQEETFIPLMALFQAQNIRILGTMDEPLFCANDVAEHIGDINYSRKIGKYTRGEYLQMLAATTARGQLRQMQYLTEAGLYKYLLQSKGEKAEMFQRFAYKLLKTEREHYLAKVKEAAEIRISALEKINSDLLDGNTNLCAALKCRNKMRGNITIQIEKTLNLGCLYFIGEADNETAPTKIGYTKNLSRRLQCLQISNSAELIVRRSILVTNPADAEYRAHKYFKEKHHRGEWFNLTRDDICGYTDNCESSEIDIL